MNNKINELKIKANILVAIQFGSIAVLLLTGPFLARQWPLMLIELFGLFLGIVSILNMGIGNTRISPLVRDETELRINYIYRWIRHPMYLAVLLTFVPLAISKPDYYRLFMMLLLIIALFMKIRLEENMLKERFSAYHEYMRKSWRLIPFIY